MNTEKILSQMKNPVPIICDNCTAQGYVSEDYYDKIVERKGFYLCNCCKSGKVLLINK
jgi:hypothetical protein